MSHSQQFLDCTLYLVFVLLWVPVECSNDWFGPFFQLYDVLKFSIWWLSQRNRIKDSFLFAENFLYIWRVWFVGFLFSFQNKAFNCVIYLLPLEYGMHIFCCHNSRRIPCHSFKCNSLSFIFVEGHLHCFIVGCDRPQSVEPLHP